MFPLVAIATSLVPELIKLIAGDKTGQVASNVAKAVQKATDTDDPAAAKQKIDTDAAAKSALQVQLAQIAVAAAQVQNEEADRQRVAQLEELREHLRTPRGASAILGLASQGSFIAWVAPAVSFLVMIGFYLLLAILIVKFTDPKLSEGLEKNQLINICIGALVAAFSTVVNFWLGSSKGSQDKDRVQAAQTTEALKTAQQTTATALDTASSATAKAAAASAAAASAAAAHPPAGATPGAAGPKTDDSTNFNQCIDIVFAEEGGYTNDPNDSGGPTNFDITLHDLKEWRGKDDVTADDVKNMTKDEAREIYRSKYWNPIQCNDLPNGVDLQVFDFGINAGPKTAVKILQEAIGVTADGSVGPITITAAKAADARTTIQNFSERRLEYYRSLPDWVHFGTGWTNRTNSVERAAMKMAGTASS